MKNITGRDFRFFLLGVLAMLLFVIAYEWQDFKRGFMDGYGSSEAVESTTNTAGAASGN